MSDEPKTTADDLTKSKKPGDIQLTEEDLKDVAGGKVNVSEISVVKIVDKSSPNL
jgi:type VI protein secretion system component Hcp